MRYGQKKAISDYWAAHYVCNETNLCSLCGNNGTINTSLTAVSPAGVNAGRLNFCICPNGQVQRFLSETKIPEEV